MAGPWEKYQQQAGPWQKYAAPSAKQPQHPEFDGSNIPGYDPATGEVSPRQPSVGMDMVSSLGAGIGRGAADLAGIPGTLADLGQGALQWGLSTGYGLATGKEPDPRSESGVERFFAGPTPELSESLLFGGKNPLSGDVLKKAASVVTGGATDYQPYTTAGKFARTAGEFLPSAMAFGGGGALNALRYGVVPALSSEAAGQATEGTAFEPWARVGGALAGGLVGSRIGAPKAPPRPTAQQIKQSAGYGDKMTDMLRNARTSDQTYGKIVGELWDDVKQAGTSYEVQQNFGRTLQNEMKLVQQEGASLHSLERLRRALRSAGGGKLDTPNQAIASRLIDKLDDAVNNLSASNIAASGSTGKPVLDVLKEARAAYNIGKKAEIVEAAIENARNAASGFENGLRIEFRKLLKAQRAKNFNATELNAIRSVARGNFTTNALRWIGGFGVPIDNGRNFLGSVMGGGVGGTLGAAIAGPAGAAVGGPALMGLGTAAKYGASRATQNLADIADALVRAGPAAQSAYAAGQAARQVAGRQAIARALLQSQSAAQIPSAKERAR